MTEFLFDPPWYLPAVFGLIAVVLIYSANARQKRGLLFAGLASALVAVLIVLAGRLVETDREKVLRETREIVDAVDRRDWAAFGRLLDEQVRFAIYKGRDTFQKGAARTVESVNVKDVRLSALHAEPETGGYVVTLTATAEIGEVGRRVPTNWKLFWTKEGDAFRLYQVESMPGPQFEGHDPVTTRLESP